MVLFIFCGFIYAQFLICNDEDTSLEVVHASRDVVSIEKTKTLRLSTDKSIYQSGEPVIINFENKSTKPMIQNPLSFMYIRSNRYLGENFAVGVIEKKEDNGWFAVEPLWRCAGSCNEICSDIPPIRPNETRDFIWDQFMVICDQENGLFETEFSGSGVYRIKSGLENENGESENIFSNEFKILQKLDDN